MSEKLLFILLIFKIGSTFQLNNQSIEEVIRRPSSSHPDSALLADTALVCYNVTHDCPSSNRPTQAQAPPTVTLQPTECTPSSSQDETYGMPFVWKRLRSTQISGRASSIILASWRTNTKKQYKTYFNKWQMFCSKWNIDPMQPLVNHVLDFLCELFDAGLGYSALNTARSAMSSFVFIDNVPVGSHSLVKRFVKGVFEQRPSLPRYQETWDVSLVLDLLRSWVPLNTISMKKLTLKLSMLIALTTAQRCQTLHLIKINDIVIQDTGSIIIYIGDKVKQSKPGLKQIKLWLHKCSEDKNNCVATTMQVYLQRTTSLRSDEQLFISFLKPYKSVSKSTIARMD